MMSKYIYNNNNALFACWWDSKVIPMMSSFHQPLGGIVKRRERGRRQRIERAAPILAVDYNINMGGVDLFDQLRIPDNFCLLWRGPLLQFYLNLNKNN